MNTEPRFDPSSLSPMDQFLFENLLPGAKDAKFKSGRMVVLVGAIMAASGGGLFFFPDKPAGVFWLMFALGAALLVFGATEFIKGSQLTSCTLLVARDSVNSRVVLLVEGKGVRLEVLGPLSRLETHSPTGTIIMDEKIHRYMVTFQGSNGESVTLYDRMGENKLPAKAMLAPKASQNQKNSYYSEELGKILFGIEELQAQDVF